MATEREGMDTQTGTGYSPRVPRIDIPVPSIPQPLATYTPAAGFSGIRPGGRTMAIEMLLQAHGPIRPQAGQEPGELLLRGTELGHSPLPPPMLVSARTVPVTVPLV